MHPTAEVGKYNLAPIYWMKLSLIKLSGLSLMVTLLTAFMTGGTCYLLLVEAHKANQQAEILSINSDLSAKLNQWLWQQHHTLGRVASDPSIRVNLNRPLLKKLETPTELKSIPFADLYLVPNRIQKTALINAFGKDPGWYRLLKTKSSATASPFYSAGKTKVDYLDVVHAMPNLKNQSAAHLVLRVDSRRLLEQTTSNYADRSERFSLLQKTYGMGKQTHLNTIIDKNARTLSTRIGNSHLSLRYRMGSEVNEPSTQYWLPLLVTVITMIMVAIFTHVIVGITTIRWVRHDLLSLKRMIDDIGRGAIRGRYTVKLSDFGPLAKAVSKSKGIFAHERRKLIDIGMTDHLSSLPNRLALDIRLQEFFIQAKMGYSFALLLIDIDHFKYVNDRHGHDMGDLLIQQFAGMLQESVRSSDFIARLGGDEFCIVFAYADLDAAKELAERLRSALRAEIILNLDLVHPLRWTGGLAVMQERDNKADDVLWRADQALLLAKSNGRNQTDVYTQRLRRVK